MKFKNILLIFISIMLVFTLVACGNKNDSDANKTDKPTTSESTSQKDDSTKEETESKEDNVNKEEQEKKAKEECEKVLKDVKVELLSITSEKYEDAKINGYLVSSNDYETATLLTIGVKLPKDAYYNHYSGITICGETATGKDGKPSVQTSYNTSWISEDRDYALMVLRVGGDIDPTKATVTIKGKTSGVTVDTKFENNGIPVGFDSAKEAFIDEDDAFGCGSSVVKLKGRHYLIIRRYASSSGWGGNDTTDYSTATQSFVLVPLDKGFKPTLTKNDVKMVVNGSVANTKGTLMVNESGRIDASSLDDQTTLEVEFVRTVVEQRNSEDEYEDEVYDKINDDIKELAQMTTLEIDDGDGNKVILKMR